jgi:tRNA(Ile)-lysidine synthase
MNVAKELLKFVEQIQAKHARFIVAVSGGRDSMALLHACSSMQLDVVVAHCNFGLRGNESDADMKLVETFCTNYHIPFELTTFNTKEKSLTTGKSIQETARQLRYDWFEKLRLEKQADFVLTAHHGNDLIETFLFHACRGAGLNGLSSIPLKNDFILRPWLSVKQSDIEEYVLKHQIPFRQDASNDSTDYTRNFIRHKIIPLLSEVNQQAEGNLIDAIHHIKEAAILVEEKINDLTLVLTSFSNNSLCIKHHQLTNLPYAKTLLHHWLKPYGFSTTCIREASELQQTTGRIWLSERYQMLYNRGELLIAEIKNDEQSPLCIDQAVNTQLLWQDKIIDVEFLTIPPSNYEHGVIYLDVTQANFPFIIRTWEYGDAFTPLGMASSKKVSDFFIDEKIGLTEKHNIPILCADNQIMAIIPYRIDHHYRIQESTTRIMRISFQ